MLGKSNLKFPVKVSLGTPESNEIVIMIAVSEEIR